MSAELTLFTINMSHFSEKIRWLLDAAGLVYREQPLTPALHVLPMLLKGGRGQTTVPLLQRGHDCVQDSPRIVNWLVQEYGLNRLLPPEQRAEILAVQARFDRIGKPIARYLYLPGFAHGPLIRDIWTQFSSPAANVFVRVGYAVIKPLFRLKLNINQRAVRQAQQQIDAEIHWLEQQLQGRRYLVGNAFSFADIAAAAILAPLACPPEHPVYGHPEFRAKMAGPAQQWANSAALEWVRDVYAQHRGRVWANLNVPRPLLREQM